MIWLILGLGLALRLVSLNQSLWLDEAISVLAVRNHDLIYIWTHFFTVDIHPPGFYWLLWLTGNFGGWGEVAIRIPSVLFGLGTIYLTYKIGQLISSKKVGLIAALVLSVNPLHLYYSQEARMYSFAAFAVSLSFYYFIKLVNNTKGSWLGYGLSLVIVFYSDYLAYLAVFVQLLWLFFSKVKPASNYWKGLAIGLFSFILISPLILQQFVAGMRVAHDLPVYGQNLGSASFKELLLLVIKTLTGRIPLGHNLLWMSLAVLLGLIYGYLLVVKFRKEKTATLIWLWLLVPPILTFGLSFWLPLFSYYRFIFILPAFCLLVGLGISNQHFRFGKMNLILLSILEIFFSFIYLINSQFQREDWKGAVSFTDKFLNPSQLVLFEDNNLPAPFLYYSHNLGFAQTGLDHVPALTISDLASLASKLNGRNEVYVYNYLVDITDPKRLLNTELINLGYNSGQVFNFNGVGFITLYTKSSQ